MPQHTLPCQLGASPTPETRGISPRTGDTQSPQPTHDTGTPVVEIERTTDYSGGRFAPVRGVCQEVSHTKSRRSSPRKWRGAVVWLIAAGLHPRANATTQRVAEDLADRMDYDTGHVLYRMHETAARVGIDVSNVKRHVSYLRELGALAWVQRGSRANIRRSKGEDGYAGTATVYAAVIPAVFDRAMGHRVIGSGYEARVVVDLSKRPKPVDNRENGAVDNSAKGSCAPPSLTVVKEESQVQVVGGVTTTAQRQRKTSAPTKSSSRKRATILGATVTAAGMRLGDKLARAIRRRVSWTRKATHDQLRWVCADMAEQQWTEDQAVRFVVEAGYTHRAGFAWNPDRPHRLIAAELRAHQEQQEQEQQQREDLANAVAWEDSTAYREALERASLAAMLAPAAEPEPERTDEDRERARMDWNVWPEVLEHLEEDQDDAIDLYGVPLCQFAISQGARQRRTDYAYI